MICIFDTNRRRITPCPSKHLPASCNSALQQNQLGILLEGLVLERRVTCLSAYRRQAGRHEPVHWLNLAIQVHSIPPAKANLQAFLQNHAGRDSTLHIPTSHHNSHRSGVAGPRNSFAILAFPLSPAIRGSRRLSRIEPIS